MTDDVLIVTAAPPLGRTFQRTGSLRYALPPYTTTEPARLQEEWRYLDTGETFWRNIPTVVVNDLDPKPRRAG